MVVALARRESTSQLQEGEESEHDSLQSQSPIDPTPSTTLHNPLPLAHEHPPTPHSSTKALSGHNSCSRCFSFFTAPLHSSPSIVAATVGDDDVDVVDVCAGVDVEDANDLSCLV